MIPKIIHQIWIGHYNIPKRETALYQEIRDKHPDYEYHLWTDDNLPIIPLQLKEIYDEMYSRKDYVFCADMIRWLVVYEYGGWYLDIDWQFVKSFDFYYEEHVKQCDGAIFGHWGVGWQHVDDTIANNVFGFVPKHEMPFTVIANMPKDVGYSNAPYSPSYCGQQMRVYLGLPNFFTSEIWEYHRIIREELTKKNILWGDYNTFQNENFRHLALFAWNHENMAKFANGEIE